MAAETLRRAFPEATAALKRLRRSWHLFRASYDVFSAIEHLEKMGPEGTKAVEALRQAFIYDYPNWRGPKP